MWQASRMHFGCKLFRTAPLSTFSVSLKVKYLQMLQFELKEKDSVDKERTKNQQDSNNY